MLRRRHVIPAIVRVSNLPIAAHEKFNRRLLRIQRVKMCHVTQIYEFHSPNPSSRAKIFKINPDGLV